MHVQYFRSHGLRATLFLLLLPFSCYVHCNFFFATRKRMKHLGKEGAQLKAGRGVGPQFSQFPIISRNLWQFAAIFLQFF